jgi:hypothetical protein
MSDRNIITASCDPRINIQPIELLIDNVNSIGLSVSSLFIDQATALSVDSCDNLLHALSAADTAVRKVRVRLVQEGNQYEK